MGEKAQSGGDAHRHAHRGHGRGRLEGSGQKWDVVHQRDNHGSCQENHRHDQCEGERVHHPAVGDAPAPQGDLFSARQARPQGEKKHAHRHGLESACGGAAGAPDEHQDTGHRQGAVPQIPLSDGVKAGRTQGDGLEGGVEHTLPAGHITQRCRIVPLRQQEKEPAPQDQGGGKAQYHLAIQGESSQVSSAAQNILPYKKAQSADGDERHDRKQYDRISIVRGQAGKLPLRPQQVEPRVAESGNGMKDPAPQAL